MPTIWHADDTAAANLDTRPDGYHPAHHPIANINADAGLSGSKPTGCVRVQSTGVRNDGIMYRSSILPLDSGDG